MGSSRKSGLFIYTLLSIRPYLFILFLFASPCIVLWCFENIFSVVYLWFHNYYRCFLTFKFASNLLLLYLPSHLELFLISRMFLKLFCCISCVLILLTTTAIELLSLAALKISTNFTNATWFDYTNCSIHAIQDPSHYYFAKNNDRFIQSDDLNEDFGCALLNLYEI